MGVFGRASGLRGTEMRAGGKTFLTVDPDKPFLGVGTDEIAVAAGSISWTFRGCFHIE